ncbi:glyoxal oxidase [Ceratobasidium sp. AG-Ba]|nr:glyoxal oxidase [Ceratobasidium sp. AG-Ba]
MLDKAAVIAAASIAFLTSPASAQYVLSQGGTSGVNAMQMTVASNTSVLIIDKYEQNPLLDASGSHALASLYYTLTDKVRALNMKTNSFCATGTWLSNGTLAHAGGNPMVSIGSSSSANGLQGMRLFNSCADDGACDFYESPQRIRLTSPRWYPSSCRLPDGSSLIFGGAFGGGWTNFKELNNPTYEYFPPKNINGYNGVQIPSQFLIDSLPHNMFPHMIATLKEWEISSQSPASKQCSRMALDSAGIAAGWTTEEMPDARVMPDATILPDGKILIVNGAKSGTAGYGNVQGQVGQSNADNPAFTPVLYDPAAPAGSRFSSVGMPTSKIARMYHSVSTLLPDGRVMIAGSNPNAEVETRPYKTEYQVEYISPPYMTKARPSYSGLPATWDYKQQIVLSMTLPATLNAPTMLCSLMDLGFSTHGVHMDMRMVKLPCSIGSNRKTLIVTGPPNANIYPPGPGWLFVSANGVPSKAQRVLIGTGGSPPVDQGAIDKWVLLASIPLRRMLTTICKKKPAREDRWTIITGLQFIC